MALHISIPHKNSQADALKKIKKVVEQLKIDHADSISNLKEDWTGNAAAFSFDAKGFHITGNLIVMSSSYELSGQLPWSLNLFKTKIEKIVKDQARELLKKV